MFSDYATHHLVKIEPESRWVSGHNIKYSIDDFKRDGEFEKVGVRNLEASRRMKEMKVGQQGSCAVPHPLPFSLSSSDTFGSSCQQCSSTTPTRGREPSSAWRRWPEKLNLTVSRLRRPPLSTKD